MTGTLEIVDDTRAILRFERRLRHSPERVWRAITEPDEQRHWSPAVAHWTLEPGATFEVEGAGDGNGTILEVDPPHLLAFDWGGQILRYELRADDGGAGCTLIFTHEFDDPRLGAQHAAGWEACFDRMDALFAGSSLSERDSLARWPEYHERYAEELGVDPEIGRRTFAEHTAGD